MNKEKVFPRIIDPIQESEDVVWLGNEPGTIRKVYRVLTTDYFKVLFAMFTPGEGGSVHVHDNAEEFSYSITGGSTSYGKDNCYIGEQSAGKIKWNPVGSYHGGKTSYNGISLKLAVYSKGGELPTNDGIYIKKEETR